jgi:hypothetical protein
VSKTSGSQLVNAKLRETHKSTHSSRDPLNPLRIVGGPSYDTQYQSRDILGIGVVAAIPKIYRVSWKPHTETHNARPSRRPRVECMGKVRSEEPQCGEGAVPGQSVSNRPRIPCTTRWAVTLPSPSSVSSTPP